MFIGPDIEPEDDPPPASQALPVYWRIELLIADARWEPLTTLPAWTEGIATTAAEGIATTAAEGIATTAAEAYRMAMNQLPPSAVVLGDCPARCVALDGFWQEIEPPRPANIAV
jgi:hypothetical protein